MYLRVLGSKKSIASWPPLDWYLTCTMVDPKKADSVQLPSVSSVYIRYVWIIHLHTSMTSRHILKIVIVHIEHPSSFRLKTTHIDRQGFWIRTQWLGTRQLRSRWLRGWQGNQADIVEIPMTEWLVTKWNPQQGIGIGWYRYRFCFLVIFG